MSVVSMTALIGTPISYSAWHRNHHKTDTIHDPHSPEDSHGYILYLEHTNKFTIYPYVVRG